MPFDFLFRAVNDFARSTPWLHGPASVYATWGLALFAALWLIGWWRARGRSSQSMTTSLLGAVAVPVAFGIQQLVVLAVREPRPYAVHPDALVLVAKTTDPSFPSDHACVAGAITAGLFVVDRRLGWIAAVLATLMAATRVYVGAHWPLDVVAGLALGAGLALAVVLPLRARLTPLVRSARSTRAAWLFGS